MSEKPLNAGADFHDEASLTNDSTQGGDCWNRIGVWSGSGSTCKRLSDVIHCRNCETFIAAGRLVFERELSEEYLQENLVIFSASSPSAKGESVDVIVFRLGKELFALPTTVLDAITESKPVHRLPHMKSAYIRGVVNISGEVCLCHSLMAVLDVDAYTDEKEDAGRQVYMRMIVVRIDEGRYVFPVDEIKGMTDFELSSLRAAPSTITVEVKELLKGAFQFNNQDVAVLDAGKLHRLLGNGLF